MICDLLKLLIIDLVVVRIAIAIYEMALALEAPDSISRVSVQAHFNP